MTMQTTTQADSPIAVVGAGAIGGLLAARWAGASVPVRVLARTPEAERRLALPGLRAQPKSRPCAAAFFCVKAGDLSRAIAAARPWIGPRTTVVGLQNGVAHAKLLRRAFGAERTVIGSCYIAADRRSPSEIVHNGGNEVWLAQNRPNRAAVAAVRGFLRRAGWKVKVWPDEDRLLWTKLCFNAATNPMLALCGAANGELASDPVLRAIMLKTVAEAVSSAKRLGHRPLFDDMAGLLLKAGGGAPAQRNSMLQDLAAGRRTEVDAIVGPFLKIRPRPPLLDRLAFLVSRLERALA